MPGERMVYGMPSDRVTELPPELDSFGILDKGGCKDFKGKWAALGQYYTPGPDSCTVCVCDKGKPKWCQAVLCAPPNNCKSFRVGSNCCEFECLDDSLSGKAGVDWNALGGDMGLRLVASAITAALSLALLIFLVHRLRKKRRRTAARHEARGTSLGSIDHLTGSGAFLNGQDQVDFLGEQPPPHYVFWKPPGYVPPIGEAPPPYSEAGTPVSSSRGGETSQNPSMLTSVTSATIPLLPQPTIEVDEPATEVEPPKTPTEESRLLLPEGVEDGEAPPTVTATAPSLSLLQAPAPLLASRGTIELEEATPPPSYADILAESSTSSTDRLNPRVETEVRIRPRSDGLGMCYTVPRERRARNALSQIERDAAMQRFSLQLALDLSDSSSSSLSLSPANPVLSPSSSSSASSGDVRVDHRRSLS